MTFMLTFLSSPCFPLELLGTRKLVNTKMKDELSLEVFFGKPFVLVESLVFKINVKKEWLETKPH